MTEDEAAITVSTEAVYEKYRTSTEAELNRLRFELARTEAALDSVVEDRRRINAELRDLKQSAALPRPEDQPARQIVPEAPGAGQPRRAAQH